MTQTHIYIAVDSCSPRKSKKNYSYILECIISGEPVTKDGYGQTEGSYHKAVLEALADALERFNRECEITIHSENDFVLNMMEMNLQSWSENGFVTAKGKPVANQEQWMRVHEAEKKHVIHTEHGRHTYSGWLSGEMERRKEQNDV